MFIALYIFQGVLVECFCNARAVKGCVVLAVCWCLFCLLCSVRSAVRLVGLEITGAQALLTKHLLAPSLASCLNLQLTSVHRVLSGRAGEWDGLRIAWVSCSRVRCSSCHRSPFLSGVRLAAGCPRGLGECCWITRVVVLTASCGDSPLVWTRTSPPKRPVLKEALRVCVLWQEEGSNLDTVHIIWTPASDCLFRNEECIVRYRASCLEMLVLCRWNWDKSCIGTVGLLRSGLNAWLILFRLEVMCTDGLWCLKTCLHYLPSLIFKEFGKYFHATSSESFVLETSNYCLCNKQTKQHATWCVPCEVAVWCAWLQHLGTAAEDKTFSNLLPFLLFSVFSRMLFCFLFSLASTTEGEDVQLLLLLSVSTDRCWLPCAWGGQ